MHVPNFFVVSKLYSKLKRFEPSCLFESSSGVPVQIYGPKGVGKSTCLYALALQMTISAVSTPAPKILYFTERSATDLQCVEQYLQCISLNCTFDKVVHTIINHIVLCLDFGKYRSGRLEQFARLFNSMYRHIRIVMAHSSGRGHFVDRSLRETFQSLRWIGDVVIIGENFSDDEVKKISRNVQL